MLSEQEKSDYREIVMKHMTKMAKSFSDLNPKNSFYTLFPSRAVEFGRSFDSKLGHTMEGIIVDICKRNFCNVSRKVKGFLYSEQSDHIGHLLSMYEDKETRKTPEISDYLGFQVSSSSGKMRKELCDIVMQDGNKHYLVEVKLGGDMDVKKAQGEKRHLLELYYMMFNSCTKNDEIKILVGTVYNCCGEGNDFNQKRVLQYFNRNELLIGTEFWSFIARSEEGGKFIWDEFVKCCPMVNTAYEKNKERVQKELNLV